MGRKIWPVETHRDHGEEAVEIWPVKADEIGDERLEFGLASARRVWCTTIRTWLLVYPKLVPNVGECWRHSYLFATNRARLPVYPELMPNIGECRRHS